MFYFYFSMHFLVFNLFIWHFFFYQIDAILFVQWHRNSFATFRFSYFRFRNFNFVRQFLERWVRGWKCAPPPRDRTWDGGIAPYAFNFFRFHFSFFHRGFWSNYDTNSFLILERIFWCYFDVISFSFVQNRPWCGDQDRGGEDYVRRHRRRPP